MKKDYKEDMNKNYKINFNVKFNVKKQMHHPGNNSAAAHGYIDRWMNRSMDRWIDK